MSFGSKETGPRPRGMEAGAGPQADPNAGAAPGGDGPVDADYEVVDDDKEKK